MVLRRVALFIGPQQAFPTYCEGGQHVSRVSAQSHSGRAVVRVSLRRRQPRQKIPQFCGGGEVVYDAAGKGHRQVEGDFHECSLVSFDKLTIQKRIKNVWLKNLAVDFCAPHAQDVTVIVAFREYDP